MPVVRSTKGGYATSLTLGVEISRFLPHLREIISYERSTDGGLIRICLTPSMTALSGTRIRHTVVFALVHAPGSPEEGSFLAAGAELGGLPGVEEFESLRQVSAKNGFTHGFSMEFADRAAYAGYNDHPQHVAFVRDRWIPEVREFLEIDYAAPPLG